MTKGPCWCPAWPHLKNSFVKQMSLAHMVQRFLWCVCSFQKKDSGSSAHGRPGSSYVLHTSISGNSSKNSSSSSDGRLGQLQDSIASATVQVVPAAKGVSPQLLSPDLACLQRAAKVRRGQAAALRNALLAKLPAAFAHALCLSHAPARTRTRGVRCCKPRPTIFAATHLVWLLMVSRPTPGGLCMTRSR